MAEYANVYISKGVSVNTNARLVILVGPSGTGKSTLATALEQRIAIRKVISCTTRVPRSGEVDGKDYRFLSRTDFNERMMRGEFVEYDLSRSDHYGILREDINRRINSVEAALLVMNIVGVKSVTRLYPGAQVFFITAPIDQLLRRLDDRDMSEESRRERKAGLEKEFLVAASLCITDIVDNSDGHLAMAIQQICDTIVRKINDSSSDLLRC